jgi:beta-lactam-binding protein with PASTA domain
MPLELGGGTIALTIPDELAHASMLPPSERLGEKLASAKTKIRSGGSVGSITRKASRSAKRGRVLSQSPRPGETKAHGAKVSLKVGKG